MERVLIYYPFTISENANSGSKLRPKEMLKAFNEWGLTHHTEIILISGNSSERITQFNKLKKTGKLDNLLFCYMENQTIPLWLTDSNHLPKNPFVDRTILNYLKQRNVPVGVFYRDVYWKFDELYPLKGTKKKIMQFIYRLEEKFYEKYVDTVFLPSQEMGKFVNINKPKTDLPPGGKSGLKNQSFQKTTPINGIYVGGINNEDYGLFLLLDGIEIVNNIEKKCDLTIVCRKDEYDSLEEEKKRRIKKLTKEVLHVSGAELDKVYTKMDMAFIPRYKSEYNDFSVPVKLVEYLSAGLPIVATDCTAQKRLIETGQYGVICHDEKQSIADAILEISKNHLNLKDNISRTFMHDHSWQARVEKVKSVLCKEVL